MREELAELGEWQKNLLTWDNDRRNCWTGRMTEETAELREWKRKWLHTNLRTDREGCSIRKRTRMCISYIKQTYYSNWRASRRISLRAKRSLRNPRPMQFQLHPSFCKLPVIATWTPKWLSQRLNGGHIHRIYRALFFVCVWQVYVRPHKPWNVHRLPPSHPLKHCI